MLDDDGKRCHDHWIPHPTFQSPKESSFVTLLDFMMSELSLEGFHNSFWSCWKSSYSLAFWNLGTNVVLDNVMATLKHLSQIGFWKPALLHNTNTIHLIFLLFLQALLFSLFNWNSSTSLSSSTMIMFSLLCIALLSVGALAQCKVCLNGVTPRNPNFTLDKNGWVTCFSLYSNTDYLWPVGQQSMHKQLDFPVYGKICTVGQLAKGSLCWNIKKNKLLVHALCLLSCICHAKATNPKAHHDSLPLLWNQ